MLKLIPILTVSLLATAVVAQVAPDVPVGSAPTLDPETGRVRAVGELRLPPVALADGWLELTPLATDAEAILIQLPDRQPEDGELRLVPAAPGGAAMLCTGARGSAVLCEQVFVPGVVWVEPDQTVAVEVRFETGLPVAGRYLLDGWPLSGARVSVVPAGLATARAFTVPLGPSSDGAAGSSAAREVVSDADGRFEIPPLAAGEYFLETVLPSGRVHRGDPFLLPAPEIARRQTAASESARVVWDLGDLDVADGLVVELVVGDAFGRPLAGAVVAGRQGDTPETVVSYEATTDAEGRAKLSGFSVEEPVHLSCRAPGYLTWRREHELVPVYVECALEALAAVGGEVVGTGGAPLPGAHVTLRSTGDDPAGSESPSSRSQAVDAAGLYAIGELPAGSYRLSAAAPGHEVATTDLDLDPGQELILEPIVLRAGRELAGLVVDAESREPLAGVEVRSTSPPGAVSAVSDGEGRFTFASGGDEPLVLALASPEHVRREVSLTLPRRVPAEPLRFELERGGWIRAVVWDEATDLPCQGCGLRIEPSAARWTTDGFGVATSQPLAPGEYRVYRPRVLHRGSAVISRDDAEYRSVWVRRGKTSTVRFGQRQETVRVSFQPPLDPGWSMSARSARRFERFFASGDGSFEVRRPPGESVDLYLHRYDPVARSEIEVLQGPLPATAPGGEWVMPLADTRLSGRGWSAGAPIAGQPVQLMTLDRQVYATVRTRPDGTFEIPHVPPGAYAVILGRANAHFVSLRPGQSLDLGTLELIAGGY